jgi:GTP-binding protein
MEHNPPPLFKQRPAKIFYATQISELPPTIVLFCNNPHAFAEPYRRFLLGVFRDNLPYGEVPVKLYLRKREQSDPREEKLPEAKEEKESPETTEQL